ncbi:MAG: elongation factor P [Candidatus Woesebacteria bacterium]|jgi:elongation factor P
MPKIKAGNIKKGTYILYQNQAHYVVQTKFVSPGKGSAFTRTKLRNVKSGSTFEFAFKSHDTIEQLDVESKEMQFLYLDGDEIVFMDQRTYEQLSVPSSLLEGKEKFLVPELSVYLSLLDGKAIGVSLPPKVKMKVKKAAEAIAGDRQTAGKKPVTMETGLIVQAPLFIKQGDTLIIDTESGEYVSRG